MVNWLLPVAMFPKTFTNFFFENMAQIAFPIFLIFVLVKLYLQPALVNELVPERRTLQIWGAMVGIQFLLFDMMLALLGFFTVVSAPRKYRKIWLSIMAAGVVVVIAAYMVVPFVHDLLDRWIFNKSGTDNRLGGTIGLAKTFLSHPFLGVGFGNEGYFIEQYLPEWSKHNSEYINVYSKMAYPVLNDMLGWLARYGAVVVLSGLWLLGGLVVRAVRAYQNILQDERPVASYYRIALRAFTIMVPLTLIVSCITQINAFSWPMLLMYFFYWRVIHLAEESKN